jgi:pimeloyl-ACP methyl ester carboxylesterase
VNKQQILLLHGAIGSKEQLKEAEEKLASSFTVHRINFSGHGGVAFPKDPFSIKLFAGEVMQYLNSNNIEQVNIFGYSMGGYVAMYLAKYHPQKINKVITLATKFLWDSSIAEKEIKMLDVEKIETKIPAFAATLKERHHPQNWKDVLQKTRNMLKEMGQENPLQLNDYNSIQQPCLLMLGDRDKMVTPEETLSVYKQLPYGQLSILPNTGHPIESVNIQPVVSGINFFLA